MKKTPLISHDAAQRSLEDALRLRVGSGKRFSFDSLEDATGIPSRTLRSYAGEGATPGLHALLSLFAVLGPSFTSDVLAETGQAAQPTSEADADYMGALSLFGSATSQIAEAMADGKIDHRERAEIRAFMKDLIEAVQPLAQDETTIPIKGVVT